MRYILTYEAKRMTHSQEEQDKVSSSQDTLLLREERSSVSALVNGINACLSGADVSENNESLKVEKMAATSIQEECQQQSVYPWIKGFEETSRSSLSCKSLKKLENLMTTFLGYVTESVKVCYTRPNRAAKLRKCLNQTLLFFHIYYQDVRKPGKRSSYLDLMTELVAMYIDMEIKAACRQKEKVKKITSRITSALYLLLDKSEDHILDAILKAKLINKQNKDVCLPVLGKIVNQVPLPLSEMSYVRYLLIFKLFKKVIQGTRKEKQQKSEEESRINKLAVLKLKPPDNFVEKAKIFTDVLPKIPPKSKKNITHFFMQAKLNLKNACAAFLKGVKEFQESLYGSTDKELFCSKQLSVFPVNNDKVDGGAGCLNGFSSDMWASVDLESLVQNSQVRDVSSCKKECGKKVKEKVKKKKKNKNIGVKDKKEDIEKIRKKKLKKNKILGVCGDTISMLEDKVLGSKKGKGDKKKKKKTNVKAELTSSESTDESTSLPETSSIVDSLFKDLSAVRKMSPESLSNLSRITGTSNASEDSQNVVSTGIVQKQEISNYEEMSDVSDTTIETSTSLLQNERPTTTMSTSVPAFGPVSAVCTAIPLPLLPSYTSPPPPPPPTSVASLEQPTTTTPQGGPPPPYLNQTELLSALHLKRSTDSRSASPATPSIHASSPHISACSSSVSSPHRNVPNVCAGLPVGFTPSIPPPPLPTYPPPPPPPLPSSSGLRCHAPVSYLPPLPSSPAPLQPPLPRSPAPPLPPLPSTPAPTSSGFSLPPMSVPPPLSFLSTIPPPPTPPSVLSHGIHHPSVLLPSVLNTPRPPPTPTPPSRPTITPPPHSLASSILPSRTPPPPPPTPASTPVLLPPPIPPTLPPSRTPPLPNSSTYPPLSNSSAHHPLFTSSISTPSASSPAPTQTPRASTTSSRSVSSYTHSVLSRPPMVSSLSSSVSTSLSHVLDSPRSPPHVSSLNACTTSAVTLSTGSLQKSSQGVTLALSNTVSTQSVRATCTPSSLYVTSTPLTSRPSPTPPPLCAPPTPPSSRTTPTPPPSHTTPSPSRTNPTPPPSRTTPTPPPSRATPTPPPSRTTPTPPPSRTTPTPPPSRTPPTPPSRTTSTPPPSRTTTTPPSRTTPTLPRSRITLTSPPLRTIPTPPPSRTTPSLPPLRATRTPPPSHAVPKPLSLYSTHSSPSRTTPTPPSRPTTSTPPPSRTTTATPPPSRTTTATPPPSRTTTATPPPRTTTVTPPPSCTTATTPPLSLTSTTPPPPPLSRLTPTLPALSTALISASSHISVTSPSLTTPISLPSHTTSTLLPLQTTQTSPLPRAVFTSSCTVSTPARSLASSPSRSIQAPHYAKELSSYASEESPVSPCATSSSYSPQSPPSARTTTPPLHVVSPKVSSRIVISPTCLSRKTSPSPSHTPPPSPSSICMLPSEAPAPSSPCSFSSTVPSSPSSPASVTPLLTSTPSRSEMLDSDVLKCPVLSPVVTIAAPSPISPSSPMSVCADEEVSVTVTVASPDCAPSPVPPLTSALELVQPSFLEKPTTTTQAVNCPSKITVVPTALLTASHTQRHKDPCESSPAHLVSASTIPCFASRVISPTEERLEDVGAEVEVGEEAETGVEADTITSQEEEEESRENMFLANNRILSVKQEIGESVNEEKMTCDSAGEQFMLGTSEEGSEEDRATATEVCIKAEISYPEEQFSAVNTVIAPITQNRDTVIASGSCESHRPSSSGNEKKCLVTSQICKPEVQGNEAIASCGNKQEKVCMDTVSPRPVRDVLVSDIQRSISKDEESEAVSYCDSSIQNVPLSVNNDEMSSVPMDIDPEMLESFTATQVRSSNDDLVYDIIGVGEGVLFGSDNGLGGLCLGAHQEEADSPAIEVFSSSDTRSLCDLMLNLRESQLDLSQYGFERQDIVSYQDTVFHNGEIVRVRGVEENARQEESMMFAVENYDDDSDVDDDNKSLNSSYNMQGFRGRPRTADKRPPSGVAPRGFTVIVDDDKDASDVSPSSRVENDSVPSSPVQSNTSYTASNSLFSDVSDSIGYGKARTIRPVGNISSSGIASVPHSTTPKQTRINTTRCYTPMQQTLHSSSSESREDSSAEESPTKVVVQKPVDESPRSVVHHAINANRTIELKLHQLSRESITRGFPDTLDARKADTQKAEGLRAQETTKPAQRGMLLDTTSYCGKMVRPSIDTMYRGVPLQPPTVPTSIPYPAISNPMAIGKGAPQRVNTYFDCSCPECIAYNFMLMSRYGSVAPRGPPLPLSFHESPVETDSDKLKSAEKLKSENEELLRRIEESLTNNKCLDAVLDSKYKLEVDSSLPPKKRLKTIAAVSNIKSESSDKWESPKEDSFPSYPTKPMISIAELDFSERLFSKHVQRPIKTVMSNNPQRYLPYAYFQPLQQGKEVNKVSNDDSLYRSCGGEVSVAMNVPIPNTGKEAPIYPCCNNNINQLVSCEKTVKYQQPGPREYPNSKEKLAPPISENVNPIKVEVTSNNQNTTANSWEYSGRQFKTPAQLKEIPSVNYYVGMPSMKCDGNKLDSNVMPNSGVYVPKMNSVEEGKYGYSQYSRPHALDLSVEESQNIKALKSRKRKSGPGEISSRSRSSKRASRNQNINQNTDPSDPYFPAEKRMHRKHVAR